MHAALHYDYLAPLESELLDLLAAGLLVGDTIVAPECIPLRVTDVRPPVAGFVTAAYTGMTGSGHRILADSQRLTVLRNVEEAEH